MVTAVKVHSLVHKGIGICGGNGRSVWPVAREGAVKFPWSSTVGPE